MPCVMDGGNDIHTTVIMKHKWRFHLGDVGVDCNEECEDVN
jgi:hypothetical protein